MSLLLLFQQTERGRGREQLVEHVIDASGATENGEPFLSNIGWAVVLIAVGLTSSFVYRHVRLSADSVLRSRTERIVLKLTIYVLIGYWAYEVIPWGNFTEGAGFLLLIMFVPLIVAAQLADCATDDALNKLLGPIHGKRTEKPPAPTPVQRPIVKTKPYRATSSPRALSIFGPVDYYSYINSKEWRAKRKGPLARARYRCEECGTAAKPLHVHHVTYDRLGDEDLDDLEVLCERCHMGRHPEYQYKH